MNCRLAALTAFLGVAQPAWAGAWARDAGSFYAKVGAGHFAGSEDRAKLRSTALELYGEAGLGNSWELDLSARGAQSTVRKARETAAQDLEVVGKYAPLEGASAVALLIGARVSLFPKDLDPALGPDGSGLIIGGAVGRGLGPAWVNFDVMQLARLGPTGAPRLGAEVGLMGQSPVGGALTVSFQPEIARTGLRATVGSAPYAMALGAKAFSATTKGGWGLTADGAWLPEGVNDSPGFRVGGGLVFSR